MTLLSVLSELANSGLLNWLAIAILGVLHVKNANTIVTVGQTVIKDVTPLVAAASNSAASAGNSAVAAHKAALAVTSSTATAALQQQTGAQGAS